jgi:hypothetical protein
MRIFPQTNMYSTLEALMITEFFKLNNNDDDDDTMPYFLAC